MADQLSVAALRVLFYVFLLQKVDKVKAEKGDRVCPYAWPIEKHWRFSSGFGTGRYPRSYRANLISVRGLSIIRNGPSYTNCAHFCLHTSERKEYLFCSWYSVIWNKSAVNEYKDHISQRMHLEDIFILLFILFIRLVYLGWPAKHLRGRNCNNYRGIVYIVLRWYIHHRANKTSINFIPNELTYPLLSRCIFNISILYLFYHVLLLCASFQRFPHQNVAFLFFGFLLRRVRLVTLHLILIFPSRGPVSKFLVFILVFFILPRNRLVMQ